MLNLIVKDLRVSALFLWLVVPVWAVLALASALHHQGHFWLTMALAFGLMMLVPGVQWYLGSDIFVSTLPVNRSLLVRGRFATSVAVVVASLAAGTYPAILLGFAGGLVGQGWPSWVGPITAGEFLLVGAILMAVSHPVLFRWGFGPAVVTGSLVVLALAAPALGPLQTLDARAASPLAPIIRLIHVWGGPPAAIGFTGFACAGLILASVRLSMAWCRDKDV